MAALASATVSTEMAVILAVAGNAKRRCLRVRGGGFAMAISALQFGVRAGQCESCFPRVIEFPKCPAIRRVTALALPAEPAAVYVVATVAIHAVAGCPGEFKGCMTLCAADDSMQSKQREVSQVMIEAGGTAP